MTHTLRNEGQIINRKRTQRLMRLMDLESVAPKPNTSKPTPEHPVFPLWLDNIPSANDFSLLTSGRYQCDALKSLTEPQMPLRITP
jgi:hypothetical protein